MTIKAITFITLSGLAGNGWCAGGSARSFQDLPLLNTSAIMEQLPDQNAPLPQPFHIGLSIPVPAGSLAARASGRVPPEGVSLKQLTSGDLRALLQDPDPEIRKAAVRAAKPHIFNGSTQDAVTDILNNRTERADIRVEAARVLSYAVGNPGVQDTLRRITHYNNEPRELRVMAYKALWKASGAPGVLDFLLDAASSENDIPARCAAIWALFPAAKNPRPQSVLLELVRRDDEAAPVRIEALKSLYTAMGNTRVKDRVSDIARNTREFKAVRLTAIKALSAANNDPRVKGLLEDIMERERDTELRAAAIGSASPNMAEVRDYFHLNYKIEHGGYVNPIEKE